MKEQEITRLIVTMQKNANAAKRKCLYRGCEQTAISSHLLQQNGILNQIAEHGQLIDLKLDAYKKYKLGFRSVGVNDAMSYQGFCSVHDTEIFKEIESSPLSFDSYRSHLLLSYRAAMIERRKLTSTGTHGF